MASPNNDFQTMNSIYKEAYADRVKDLIPDGVKVLNMVKFTSAEKQPGNLQKLLTLDTIRGRLIQKGTLTKENVCIEYTV